MSIPLITVCALAAGKNGYTAIETWAKDAPAAMLAALGVGFDVFSARHVCPDESTIRDVLSRIDAGGLTGPAADTWPTWSTEGRRSVPMSQLSVRQGGRAPPRACGRR